MNHFKTSSGERVSKSTIDFRVREAKKKKLMIQLEIHGYNFCETCQKNDDVPIDCAHIISVDDCQKSGYCELAWDLNNITILGRKCHQKRDKTYLVCEK